MQTTRYTFDNASAIQQVDFRKLESGAMEATLHAPDNTAAGDLANVPLSLAKKGYKSLSHSNGGETVLVVSGFKDEIDLMNSLRDGGFLRGEAQRDVVGEKTPKSFTKKLRNSTVKLQGMTGLVGHAANFTAGAINRDPQRMATALFYSGATSTSAIWGAGKPGAEFEKTINGMRDYLKEQGIEIPKDEKTMAEEAAKKGGIVHKLHEFMQQHPIEVGNTLGLMGNLTLMSAGIMKGRKNGEGVDVAQTVNGLASAIGALVTILVKEKPGAMAEAHGTLGKMKAFVQEKPMRTSGLLNYTGNFAALKEATNSKKNFAAKLTDLEGKMAATPGDAGLQQEYEKTQRASRSSPFMMATALAYLGATTLGTASSKQVVPDHSADETLSQLTAKSAEMLSGVPSEKRDEAIGAMVTFLAKEGKINASGEQLSGIIQDIKTKVDEQANSPWQAKISAQQAVAQNAASQNNVRM